MGGDPNGQSLTSYLNTSGMNVWVHDSPLDCNFLFFLPPSLSLYHSIACFFGLERENVKRSNEKKSVGFFNCNVIYLFIYFSGVFF